MMIIVNIFCAIIAIAVLWYVFKIVIAVLRGIRNAVLAVGVALRFICETVIYVLRAIRDAVLALGHLIYVTLPWLVGLLAFGAVMCLYVKTPVEDIWMPLSASFSLILIGGGIRKKKSKTDNDNGELTTWQKLKNSM